MAVRSAVDGSSERSGWQFGAQWIAVVTDMVPTDERDGMKVVFDRDTCIGMYQCVEEWDRFERNKDAGKADLVGGESVDTAATEAEAIEDKNDVYELAVPEGEEFEAEFAARVCPVDAIAVYDDDGEQIV